MSRDKDGYPLSVKSHQNVHAMALKHSKSYENCSFRSKNLVYFTTKRIWQQHLTFHPVLFVNIHDTVQYEYLFLPDWHIEIDFR